MIRLYVQYYQLFLKGVAQNIYKDHLPGGSFHSLNISREMVNETKEFAKQNKFAESIFQILGSYFKNQNLTSVHAMESYIMFCLRHPFGWKKNLHKKGNS